MPIEPNETIVQRFKVTQKIQYDDVYFLRALDQQNTETECQIISPTPNAQLRKGAEEHFDHVHRIQKPAPLWYGKHEKNLVSIYERQLIPITELPQITPQEGELLLHHLLQQLAENPDPFLSGVHLTDLGLNGQKNLILRASGVLPKVNHVRPDILETEGTSVQKALYGIAIHIFSMISTLPPIKNKDDLSGFQKNPPTLTFSLPNAPQSLSSLLAIMMDPHPQKREEAFVHMKKVEPIILPISEKEKKEKRIPSSTSPKAVNVRRDLPLPQWLVFCTEKQIPLSIARRVSIFSGLDPQSISKNSNLLPLAGADTETEAQKMADKITEMGISSHVVHQHTGPSLAGIIGGSLVLSVGAFALGLSLFLIVLPIVLGISGVIAAGIFRANKVQKYYKKWNESRAPAGMSNEILQGRVAAQEARKAIVNSTLPDLAQIDMHNAIDEIDDILDGYHETKTDIPPQLYTEIHETCAILAHDIKENSQQEHSIQQLRAKSQQVQKLARQMRSL